MNHNKAFGTVQRLMEPYFDRFGLTPPQFQMLTIINRLQNEELTQRRLARELYGAAREVGRADRSAAGPEDTGGKRR